jgi:hypothetical protein
MALPSVYIKTTFFAVQATYSGTLFDRYRNVSFTLLDRERVSYFAR